MSSLRTGPGIAAWFGLILPGGRRKILLTVLRGKHEFSAMLGDLWFATEGSLAELRDLGATGQY